MEMSVCSTYPKQIKYPDDYKPEKQDIIMNYATVDQVYAHPISPTVVTLVKDLHANQLCVSKSVMKKKLMSPEQFESAKRECVIQSALKHPNVVQLYEYTETDDDFRIFMEYMNMADYLSEKIEEVFCEKSINRQRLRPVKNQDKLIRYIKEIAEGLAYVHSCGIVHCDIKLSNIFAHRNESSGAPELHMKVSDFGLALILDPGTRKAYMPLKAGTFNYLAPEVKNDAFIDTAVDIWSFGIMVYEMCVGYRPTDWGGYKYGSGPIPFPKRDWKSIDENAQNMIARCLVIDPKERITAREILEHPWLST